MLDQLLEAGWDYHDQESERLADELEAVAAAPAELLSPFVALATHTIGEHLGDWPRALRLGRRILVGHSPTARTGAAWGRLSVAAAMSDDATGAAALELAALGSAEDPLSSLVALRLQLAEALAACGRSGDAAPIYRLAVSLSAGLAEAAALDRALAASSNNLAWTLHDLPTRTAEEAALMQLAADTSLKAWRRCGTWVNEELALQLAANVSLACGDPVAAASLAGEGLAVIARHGDRPLDAARLHLTRARAAAGDARGQALALAEADAAAARIGREDLKRTWLAERARAFEGEG